MQIRVAEERDAAALAEIYSFHEKNARGRQIENVRRISRRSGFRRCLGKNKGSLKGKNVFWENIVLTQKIVR